MIEPGETRRRLEDREDRFTERKPEGAGKADFKRTIVAFANSVPSNRTAVLFVGVADSGAILGVTNIDQLQKLIRKIAENECYPPIYVGMEVIDVEGKSVLGVTVDSSPNRPHFAGPAYVRRNAESVAATSALYEELILSRDDKRRTLLEWRGQFCTVTGISKQLGFPFPMEQNYSDTAEAKIEEVTAHYVRFRKVSSAAGFTEPLSVLKLSWDDKNDRPWIYVTRI